MIELHSEKLKMNREGDSYPASIPSGTSCRGYAIITPQKSSLNSYITLLLTLEYSWIEELQGKAVYL